MVTVSSTAPFIAPPVPASVSTTTTECANRSTQSIQDAGQIIPHVMLTETEDKPFVRQRMLEKHEFALQVLSESPDAYARALPDLVEKIGGADILYFTAERFDEEMRKKGFDPDRTAAFTFFNKDECRWQILVNRDISPDELAGVFTHELTHTLGLGEFYGHLRTAKVAKHDPTIAKTGLGKTAKALVEGAKQTQQEAKKRGHTLSFADAYISVLVRAFHQHPERILFASPEHNPQQVEFNTNRVSDALRRTSTAIGY